jgi:hypothetical protein
MRKLVVVGALVVAVGVVGYLMVGAKQQNATSASGTAVAATATDSGSGSAAKESKPGLDRPPAKSSASAPAQPSNQKAGAKDKVNAMAAIRRAGDANKHLFLFIQEGDDEATRASRKTFDSAIKKMGDTVQWASVDRKDPAERELVNKYRLQAAPMPLVLVMAPNGAITGGFRAQDLTEQRLQNALASPAMQRCLKGLQERKLVLLCAQNGNTKSNDEAMKGVNDFKADTRFAQFTEIVKVDPSDAAEKGFLSQLQIDPKTEEAVTAFLAPPSALIATFKGATQKQEMVAALQAASSGCGAGGCGPSGCGPR